MAFRWHADDGPTLNTGLVAAIFQGIRTCFARKPNIFVILQGVRTNCPPPSLWIRTWLVTNIFDYSKTLKINLHLRKAFGGFRRVVIHYFEYCTYFFGLFHFSLICHWCTATRFAFYWLVFKINIYLIPDIIFIDLFVINILFYLFIISRI